MKKTIETNSSNYDKQSIAETKAELETYEIALKNNINYIFYYNDNYWKIQILNEIKTAKMNLILNEDLQDSKIKEYNEKIINEGVTLLEKDNYSGYIELLKQNSKTKFNNKEISKEQYDDEIYLLELRKEYEIYKNDELAMDWKSTLYQDVTMMKQNLRTGINSQTGKMLKIEEIEKLKDNIKIAEYRLEHDIPVTSTNMSGRSLYDIFAPSFSIVMVSILMIIISGSAISTEISKGTIKFLLFTPNKRWKVLLSKILSGIIILLVLTLILSLLSIIIGNLFFKEDGTIYVYASNGEAKSLSNLVYTILYFFASIIDILVYMFFAYMLSTITRNTALSVGVSIASYVGSGTIMQIINNFITADWIKFIPFNNLGLADKIFSNNMSYSIMQSVSSFLNETSIQFSLTVLAVCVILMIITTFDSFNKRDIV